MFNFQPIKSDPQKWSESTPKDGLPEISFAEFAARVTGEALVSFSDAAQSQALFRGLLFRKLSHLEFAGAVPDATTIVTFRAP